MRPGDGWARYDLRHHIASFDFYTWLVFAKARGARGVFFGIENVKETKWPADVVMRRFHSIIEPGPAFASLPSAIGDGGAYGFAEPSTAERDLMRYMVGGGKIEPLASVLPPRSEQFTVTIRNERRVPDRNSNVAAWLKFARRIGAAVIDDYDHDPIELRERFALYSGAEMNFGVVNGPMNFAIFGGCPVAIFRANRCREGMARNGIRSGGQYAWAGSNQRLVWQDDTYDNLMRWFESWLGTSVLPAA